MRLLMILVFAAGCSPLCAQSDTWSWGGTISFHCARLQVTSATAPSRWSTLQTTPAFSLYLRSPETSKTLFEIQVGYESLGASKELYFPAATNNWLRIYDRYRTIPLSLVASRHLFFSEKLWIGCGLKSRYVISGETRNENSLPVGTTGLIFNPEVKRILVGVCGEIMYSFRFADVALWGVYSLLPIIDDRGVKAVPYSVAITVKKRLIAGGRYGEF